MNVLVIDDQRQVVDSICAGLQWDAFGVQHVYGAYSAKEAKKIIQNFKIDILLSDIEMPEENGLELFAWTREQGYDIDCIFLTSHADFNYAKEAIRLGSVDYILQPARFEEIEAGLRKHVEERAERLYLKELKKRQNVLKEKESVLIDQTFEKMLNVGFLTAEEQKFQIRSLCHKQYQQSCFYLFSVQILQWTNQQWSSQLVRMVLSNVIGELFEPYECEVLLGGISDMDYAVLLHGNRSSITESVILEKIQTMYQFVQEKMTFQIAVYLEGYIESVHQGLEELCHLMRDNVLQKAQIFSSENKENATLHIEQLHTERWGNLLEEGNWKVIQKEIEQFFESNEKQVNYTALKQLYLEYSKAFFDVINRKKCDINSFFSEEYSYDNFSNSYATCARFLEGVAYTGKILEKDDDTEEDRLLKAKQYITENISKNITRTEVANYLYLSEEYFSRWFSKETGDPFKNYLLNQKIEYAKQLLENTGLTVGIIASKVGYDNFSYFSKMFKKKEGMTPQDYRQIHKEKI